MIAIVNIDPNPRSDGEHLYSVRINKLELFRFRHKREEPLSTCLLKATAACYRHEVEKENKKEIIFYGLFDWDYMYEHKRSDGTYAFAQPDNQSRLVVLALALDWGETKPTLFRVRKYAFHEVSEVRYSKISEVAMEKLANFIDMRKKDSKSFIMNLRMDITEATHALIRTDENRIWLPDYKKRHKVPKEER